MRWIILAVIIYFAATMGYAQSTPKSSGKSHPYYGGGKHTSSHGGTYQGGSGSSHKGGHYKNVRTNNTYGRHKK